MDVLSSICRRIMMVNATYTSQDVLIFQTLNGLGIKSRTKRKRQLVHITKHGSMLQIQINSAISRNTGLEDVMQVVMKIPSI